MSQYETDREREDDERYWRYDFDAELMAEEDRQHDHVRLAGEAGPQEVEE